MKNNKKVITIVYADETVSKNLGNYDFNVPSEEFQKQIDADVDFLTNLLCHGIPAGITKRVILDTIKTKFKGNKWFFSEVLTSCHK